MTEDDINEVMDEVKKLNISLFQATKFFSLNLKWYNTIRLLNISFAIVAIGW